jgi:anti-sigma B factor antagonist
VITAWELWYKSGMELLTVDVPARESAGQPYTVVAVRGEADVTNRDSLGAALDAEVALQPRVLIVDLSGLRFMDSSALHVLLRANRALDRHGGAMSLVAPQAAVAKMLRLTTADRLIPVFGSVAEAARGLRPGGMGYICP